MSIENLMSARKLSLVKILFLLVAVALVVSLSVAQVQAKATSFITDYRVDLDLRLFVPCAAAGAGEFVQVSGPLHIIFATTLDGKGGYQSKYELGLKGVSGTGLSTGTIYKATDGSQGTFTGTVDSPSSFGTSFKMTSSSAGSFMVNESAHVSVSSQGVLNAVVDNFSVSCKRPGYPG